MQRKMEGAKLPHRPARADSLLLAKSCAAWREKKQTLVLGCTQTSEFSSETAEKPCQGSFPLSSYLGACCNFLVSLKSSQTDRDVASVQSTCHDEGTVRIMKRVADNCICRSKGAATPQLQRCPKLPQEPSGPQRLLGPEAPQGLASTGEPQGQKGRTVVSPCGESDRALSFLLAAGGCPAPRQDRVSLLLSPRGR